MSSQSARPAPQLRCADSHSVLSAIERHWRNHAARTSDAADVYAHLSALLTDRGFFVDRTDGLEIMEHCREANLPVAEILQTLGARIKRAGYCEGSLNLADCVLGEQPVYVFYDASRFPAFAEVRGLAADRLMDAASLH